MTAPGSRRSRSAFAGAGRSAWRRSLPVPLDASTTISSATISASSSCSSGKPAGYFPRWFVSSWMDDIWGHVPDEVRPFPALSYQLTSLGGAAVAVPAPRAEHRAARGQRPARARASRLTVVRLSVPAATFAAAVFVLLPVHGESVAWITGRVDSMPALFYMASFWAFARWRATDRGRGRLYALSLALLFVALFTKQTTITMVGDAGGVGSADAPARPRAVWPWAARLPAVRADDGGVPGAAVPAVRAGRAREPAERGGPGVLRPAVPAPSRACRRRRVLRRATRRGSLVAAVGVGGLAGCCGVDRRRTGAGALALLLFFGPVWWIIGVAPTAVAGYESPRHVYLAAAGWAIVLGIVADLAWRRRAPPRRGSGSVSAVGARRRCASISCRCTAWCREWNRIAAVSHQAVLDVRGEVLSSPPGTLIIVGRADAQLGVGCAVLGQAAVHARGPHRARVHRDALAAPLLPRPVVRRHPSHPARLGRAARPSAPIVVLRWDPDTGALSRLTDREYPALRTVAAVLLQLNSREALDSNILRLVEQVPELRRTVGSRDQDSGVRDFAASGGFGRKPARPNARIPDPGRRGSGSGSVPDASQLVEVRRVLRENQTAVEGKSAAGPGREDGGARAALSSMARRLQPPFPGRARARGVRHGLFLGRREEVLGAAGRLFDRGRLRRRLHAEPDLSGGLQRHDRAQRDSARGVRPARRSRTTRCSRRSGRTTIPPRACARATTSARSIAPASTTSDEAQRAAAERIEGRLPAGARRAAGYGSITTEIVPAAATSTTPRTTTSSTSPRTPMAIAAWAAPGVSCPVGVTAVAHQG